MDAANFSPGEENVLVKATYIVNAGMMTHVQVCLTSKSKLNTRT